MDITKEEIEAFKKDCIARGLTLPEKCTNEWCIEQIKELYEEIENNSNTEKEDCKTEEMNCLQEREILYDGSNFTVFKDGYIHGEPNLRGALYEVALEYFNQKQNLENIFHESYDLWMYYIANGINNASDQNIQNLLEDLGKIVKMLANELKIKDSTLNYYTKGER